MLIELSADHASFKSVKFRQGMNIILAERTTFDKNNPSAQGLSRNGAGKSSVVDLIHFLLGGKPEGALKSEVVDSWNFLLELALNYEQLIVTKSPSNPKYVGLKFSDGNSQSISNAAWCQQLGSGWFDLASDKRAGAPSFRSLFNYFARRRRDGGFDHPTRTFRAQSNAVSETNLAFLFGLNSEIVRAYHHVKLEIKQNEIAQKALREVDKNAPSGKKRVDLEAELSGKIVAARLARDKLQEQVAKFNVLPAFKEMERELANLNQIGREFSNQDVLDLELIDSCKHALESEIGSDTPQLKQLFAEAQIVFPKEIIARYAEVENFHRKLIENRQTHLRTEILSAERRMEERGAERIKLEERRRQITAELRASGPAEELLRLRDELASREANVKNLEGRLGEARGLEQHGEKLKEKLEETVRALRQDRRDRSSIVDHASRTFSQISGTLYDEPGELAISATEDGLRFSPSTPADQSAGVMSMEIFCFDLTIAALSLSRGIGPQFIIHDSHIFEPVDGRQFARALRIAANFSRDTGIQYIVTLNSDELERAEKEGKENFREFIIEPVLSDSAEGGLFGARFD